MTEINTSMLPDFVTEAAEHLDEMESLLLQLGEDTDATDAIDVLNNIFRTIHNIKGGSQYIGLEKISKLAHRLEDLLDLLRQGQMASRPSIVETLIAGRDRIVQLVRELEDSQREETPVEDLVEQLTGLIEGGDASPQEEAAEPSAYEQEATGVAATTYEKEHDQELFRVFIEHLREMLALLSSQTAELNSAPDKEQRLARCVDALSRLESSANYMGYQHLVQLYNNWGDALERSRQAWSRGDEATLDFMQSYVEEIGRLVPQLNQAEAEAGEQEDQSKDITAAVMEAFEAQGAEAGEQEDQGKDITAAVFEAFEAQGAEAEAEAEKQEDQREDITAAVPNALETQEAEAPESNIDLLMLDDFIVEAREHLTEMESCLLQLSEAPQELDVLNDIFRMTHNIKGGSQYTGLDKISKLAHRLEDLLDLLCKGKITPHPPIVEILIAGRDRIETLVNELEQSQREETPIDDLVEKLTYFIDGTEEAPQDEVVEPPAEKQVAGDVGAAIYAEEHDQELFGIFIAHLQEMLALLRSQAAELNSAPDKAQGFMQCAHALTRLISSANYMGYQDLVQLYQRWGDALEEVRETWSCGGEVTLNFMQEYLEVLGGFFPQLNEPAIDLEAERKAEKSSDGVSLRAEAPDSTLTPNTEKSEEGELFEQLSRALDGSVPQASNTEYDTLHNVFDEMVSTRREGKVSTAAKAKLPLGSEQRNKQQQAGTQRKAGKAEERKIKKSIRVDAEKINSLMNQVGELVVGRSYFYQLFNEIQELQRYFKENFGIDQKQLKPLRTFIYRLGESNAALGRTSNELQESVMKMRMLPISQVFNRYPRLVHDLTHKINKKVNLVISGEETELDKMIVEELSDPLVHIIRNAIDHGLETREERKRLGKPEVGTLILEAYQESNHIVIEVIDDGRGIDTDRIKDKAVQKGLYSEAELERMTPKELTWVILDPGFSTAEKITNISGRGVGMDVVKRNIEKLNGALEIDSELGVRTRMRLKIPLTLAIIHALMVRVGKDLFAIPLSNVEETMRIYEDDASHVEGVEVIYLREQALPIFRLSKLFGAHSNEHAQKAFVVIVSTEGQRTGFVVDELMGQEEVVIKPLADYVQEKSGFSGATIIGDGRISLILDIYELVKMTVNKQIKKQHEQAKLLKSKIKRRPQPGQQTASTV